jgi:hypothetical protein
MSAFRIGFAYGADHWFPEAIYRFSRDNLITGGDAWTAAFVLMALTMVLPRRRRHRPLARRRQPPDPSGRAT